MSTTRARVTLPDGQTLDVDVIDRRRATDGTWWYLLQIQLPGAVAVTFRAPYPQVQPIPEEPASPTEGPWLVTSAWRAAGFVYTLHGPACWLDMGSAKQVTAEEATAALADGTVACDVCRPDKALGR